MFYIKINKLKKVPVHIVKIGDYKNGGNFAIHWWLNVHNSCGAPSTLRIESRTYASPTAPQRVSIGSSSIGSEQTEGENELQEFGQNLTQNVGNLPRQLRDGSQRLCLLAPICREQHNDLPNKNLSTGQAKKDLAWKIGRSFKFVRL